MPTGYTAAIEDNKDMSLKEFILVCMPAFSRSRYEERSRDPEILLRDFEVGSYYLDKLAENRKELDNFISLSEEEQKALMEEEKLEKEEGYKKAWKENDDLKAAYYRMLLFVDGWVCPDTCKNLKEFMQSQLKESISFDCKFYPDLYEFKYTSFEEWRDAKIKNLEEDVSYSEKSLEEEVARVNKSNEWIRALREAVEKLEK